MKKLAPSLPLFGWAVWILAAGASSNSAGQVVQNPDPIRVEVDAVNVLVSVTDKGSGNFVTGLSRDDFEILEDGVPQVITHFSKETNRPLTIAMCVDTSASVRLKLDFEKEAAMDFLHTVMRPTDRALLLEFDTGVTLLNDFTSNPNDLARAIESLRAGGGTSLYDAIYLVSEQKLLFEDGRKTIIILSDGSDLTSSHTREEALRMAHLADSAIYAISTTRFGAGIDHAGESALKQLTGSTGGRVFFPFSTKQLAEAFSQIEQELRAQYSITYVPANRERDGTFRKIEVKVRGGSHEVRHRQGYYAVEPLSSM
ncbi:MAG TPA: VWA domain-containing protein [Acidobacteriota bacterium]|nr:VWA domain-containing protein [Acidobacteriota bacterium]